MNTIKRFINQFFSKMDKNQKLQLLMLVYAHYGQFEVKPGSQLEARVDALEEEIDSLVNEVFPLKSKNLPVPILAKQEPAPAIPANAAKIAVNNVTDLLTVATDAGAGPKKPLVDAGTPAPKTEPVKTDDPIKDSLVIVKPFYDCKVLQAFGIDPKMIKFEDSKLELPAFVDDASAKQFNGVYPTVEELELILDEAWDMASKGKPNKEICEFLEKNIGRFYTKNGLKQTSDFYKIANPYSKLTKILRRAFSEGYEDYKVGVSRPSYTLLTEGNGEIVMKKETDCTPATPVKTEPVKTEEKKPEMKTVQEAKKSEPVKEAESEPTKEEPAVETVEEEADEEAQENATEETVTETAEETVADLPPTVNSFDNFNDIEKLVFDKLKAGNIKALKEKDPNIQKTIKAEAREDAKLLIQSRFDTEDWAQKDEKGFWKPEFLNYWNSIIKEIGTRTNVSK